MGVQVFTERCAVALQHFYHPVLREMLGAVEGKVLQEVRKAALTVFFIKRSGLHEQAVDRLSLRVAVGKDVIGKTVFQLAIAKRIPLRQRLFPRLQGKRGEEYQYGKKVLQDTVLLLKRVPAKPRHPYGIRDYSGRMSSSSPME